MMNERTIKTAEKFGVMEKLKNLETELLTIEGVIDIEYDIDGFWDNMGSVIFLTKYDIPVSEADYYDRRRKLISEVIRVAEKHGLTRTEDSIEDYGAHFYFVFNHNKSWSKIWITYEITAERDNGTIFTDCITARTRGEARKDFKEVYRHSIYKITSVRIKEFHFNAEEV